MQGRPWPWWISALIWVLASVVGLAALAGIILATWKLPALLYGDVTEASADARLQATSGFRTALVAGLAGLAALGGLVMATRTYRLTQQGQITDRYSKAIEQLGSDKLDVRLGGIYALERIAADSRRDQTTVLQVLAAFIRSQAPWPPSQPGQYVEDAPINDVPLLERRAPDVQAALTVLGRLGPASDSRQWLDLTHTDLRKAVLYRARLSRVWLADSQLQLSVLYRTNLKGASLSETNLRGARFVMAQLQNANLDGAQLQGAECDARTVWPAGFDWKAAGVLLRKRAAR